MFNVSSLRAAVLIGITLFSRTVPLSAQQDRIVKAARPLKPVARVAHEPITEMSGIVKSQRYPNVYWVHNDSGDTARIFAIHADGSVIMPAYVDDDYYVGDKVVAGKKPYPGIEIGAAVNSDWEDIALDSDTLYLADLGNNGNARRDLGVYVVPEPNPTATTSTRALKWLPVAYPDQEAFPGEQWHYDCEAIFVYKGKLHFLTKHRAPGKINTPETGTDLYRLDTEFTDRPNVLVKLDSLPDLGGWVTAANLSPDGKMLAVLCQAPVQSVWLFEIGKTGDNKLLSGKASRLAFTEAKQCEAICFDSDTGLTLTNEQRDIFRLPVGVFQPVNP